MTDTLTHKILFKHYGENSDTPKAPSAVWTDGAVDLNETKVCCLNWDNNLPVEVKVYEVREITLPAWLPPAEWIRECVKWKWAWAIVPAFAPERVQRWIAFSKEPTAHKMAAWSLLKAAESGRHRSGFRQSLSAQILSWLETPEADRKYPSPLSARQWESITRWVARDADQLDRALYYAREYTSPSFSV